VLHDHSITLLQPPGPGVASSVLGWAEFVNPYMFSAFAYAELMQFVYTVYKTFRDINGPSVMSKTVQIQSRDARKNMFARLNLVAGILLRVVIGGGYQRVWHLCGLARITQMDYFLLVVPFHIIVGIVLASIVQHIYEGEQPNSVGRHINEEMPTKQSLDTVYQGRQVWHPPVHRKDRCFVARA
jgi:hypothetical protein